jgi:two-component system nitrogen regulation sensor histidine kinase NtrY
MGFRNFKFGLFIRIVLLSAVIFSAAYLCFRPGLYLGAAILMAAAGFQSYNLFQFVENTNRKLSRFLEAVRYSDFSSAFSVDNQLGQSFRDLNKNFNEVLDAFRKARAEKEEHWQYLNTIVQHVTVGIISFDHEDNIELLNNAGCRILQITRVKNLRELEHSHPGFVSIVKNLRPNTSSLHRGNKNQEFAMSATEMSLRGKYYKIISIQNIHEQLQQKELEAWQNLSRVLRHEIMNSITPIASLVGTLREMAENDFVLDEINREVVEDIRSGLQTIESRSNGLINFVNAYRNFTNIPKPKFQCISLHEVLDKAVRLMRPEHTANGIGYEIKVAPEDLQLFADTELVEMVLINLIKNSQESLTNVQGGKIEILGYQDTNSQPVIEISDNGTGIEQQAIDKIFTPFFTTKREGSGIGLAISRQIMQLHNGSITVQSQPYRKTTFTLFF